MTQGLPNSGQPALTKAEAAEHIAIEASRLARVANANAFPLLAYLIDMVVLEAWREATQSSPDTAEACPADLA